MRQLLRIYEDDDETVALEFSTDAADALPYLKEVLESDDQEVDIRECSATIGAVTCDLVDVPTVAGDQDSGAVTASFANLDGESEWIGHRAEHLRESSPGGPLVTLFDGIVGGLRLLDTLVTYRATLEDITARGRKVPLFTHHETVSLMPPGPVNGFGRVRGVLSVTDAGYVIPPAKVGTAEYVSRSASTGYFKFDDYHFVPPASPAWLASLARPLNDEATFKRYAYTNIAVRWRANDADPWKTFRNIPMSSESGWRAAFKNRISRLDVWVGEDPDDPSPPALPTDGQTVEVQVLYSGPPSPAFPVFVEGPAGEVLKDLLDGVYSPDEDGEPKPLRIRYDETRMSELADEVEDLFAIIDEPVDDAREWLQENWFGAFGYLPTIRDGLLYPIRLEMPDTTPTLELDDTNTAGKPQWEHTRKDAVTLVEYTIIQYDREYAEYLLAEVYNAAAYGPDAPEMLVRTQQEVTLTFRSSTTPTIGEEAVRLKPVTVREIFSPGWAHNTQSARGIATRRARHLIDRLRYGAQRVTVKASRHDADVDAANVGDWALLGPSCLPEYETGTRGMNRLAQIVAARNLNDRWREFVLIDAGPDLSPLDQPTMGALSVNDDGSVNVPVTAIPEGEAAVYYAITTSQPPASSGLWLLAGRIAAPATVVTPPAPSGADVYVRIRAEGEGRIYSTSDYDSITIPSTPRIVNVRVEIVNGVAVVYWTPNESTMGVRIDYSFETDMEAPAYDYTVDVDASLGEYEIPELVPAGRTIAVQVTPYSGWTGNAASGTAGPAEEAYATYGTPEPPQIVDLHTISETSTEFTYAWSLSEEGESWAAYKVFDLPLPADAWDQVRAEMDPVGASGEGTTFVVPKPDEGQETLVQIEARDADTLAVYDVRRISIPSSGLQPPTWELDDQEEPETGTQWVRFHERGIPIASVEAQTQIGNAPWSGWLPIQRDAGDASVVRGGTLGALEYEQDVALDLTRFSWISIRALDAAGNVIASLGPFGFDRNRMPDFTTAPHVDGTVVTISGDSGDTNSILLFRSDGRGTWSAETDGPFAVFDVSVADSASNPGIAAGARWIMTARLRSDPISDVDGDTLVREREVVVAGAGGSTDPTIDLLTAEAPGDGLSIIPIQYKASAGTPVNYALYLFERHMESGGSWTAETQILGPVTPPPTVATTLNWDSSYTKTAKGAGVPVVRFEIRAELRDNLGDVVHTDMEPVSFYSVPS